MSSLSLLGLVASSLLAMGGASNAYDTFRHTYRGDSHGLEDAVDYGTRKQLFHSRQAEVDKHDPLLPWTVAVNKFADYTESELKVMLGYKRSNRVPGTVASSLLETKSVALFDRERRRQNTLAETVDWGARASKSGSWTRNQGSCGSCWAQAAVGLLEMHSELQLGHAQRLSTEQMVDCTKNARHCGGKGGCSGATGELGLDYAQTKGLALEEGYPVDGKDDACTDGTSKAAVRVDGWTRLPENDGNVLLETVARHGPAAVSVDASQWFNYKGGVFAGCGKDAVVNHAVLLKGYGKDPASGVKYWNIRNSWGPDWAEQGHIRLLRHEGKDYCGTDNKPQDGVGCDGGPSFIEVCGMCGVLSDSVTVNKVVATSNFSGPQASVL